MLFNRTTMDGLINRQAESKKGKMHIIQLMLTLKKINTRYAFITV